MTMKTSQLLLSVLSVICSCTSLASAWISRHTNDGVAIRRRQQQQRRRQIVRSMASFPDSEFSSNDENDNDDANPCTWQDIYNADCSMDTFSARFVAANWVQSLPCAKGIEDCDFPEDMRLPGIRPESQQQEINVMEFLNIKRVDAIKNTIDDK